MRYLILVLACFVPLLIGVLPSDARDRKKPSEMYAEKEVAFMRAIAAKYVELGDEGKKMKLYLFARQAYEEALKYEENNRKARKTLGYVRRSGGWVIDPVEAKKLPEQNTKPQNMLDSEFKRLLKDYDKVEAKVKIYVAKKYAGLGTWCARENLRDQAKKAFEKAIYFDPDNEKARKGLGHEKYEGKWLTEKQIRARKEAKEGRLVNDTPSKFEGPLGLKLNKMESAHFRIETVMGVDALRDYVRKCETAYAYFLRDVGEEEIRAVWSGKSLMLVLGNAQQWHSYVDKFHGGSERDKAFTKKCQGTRGDPNCFGVQYEGEQNGHAGTIDGLVHKVAHFLVFHYWHLSQAWLQEGFAYYYTLKVLESTNTHCVGLGDYASPTGGMKAWSEAQEWRDLLKGEVSNKNDPDIRTFYGTKTKDLQFLPSIKAWSMITWLFDKHRENFMKWLVAVGEGKEQEAAFKEFFNWSFEDVDNEWRAHVLETY